MSIRKMGKIALSVFAVLVALSFILHMTRPDAPPKLPLGMQFEIADTPAEREQGLSGRTKLADDYGMLFVFPEAGNYGFWMKDMEIAIDILWLNENGTVVGVEHSVEPSTYPEGFYPPEPVPYVLEVRAGLAKERGWDVGSQIPLP